VLRENLCILQLYNKKHLNHTAGTGNQKKTPVNLCKWTGFSMAGDKVKKMGKNRQGQKGPDAICISMSWQPCPCARPSFPVPRTGLFSIQAVYCKITVIVTNKNPKIAIFKQYSLQYLNK
jgi:hypothetical protein